MPEWRHGLTPAHRRAARRTAAVARGPSPRPPRSNGPGCIPAARRAKPLLISEQPDQEKKRAGMLQKARVSRVVFLRDAVVQGLDTSSAVGFLCKKIAFILLFGKLIVHLVEL